MTRSPAPLALERVSTSYRAAAGGVDAEATPALVDVDIALEPGIVLGVIGPNGAGKTTVLRLLTRQLQPTSGRVTVGGSPLARLGRFELARLVALVAQEPAVPAGFSVREVVMMGRTPHLGLLRAPGREDEAVVDEALAAADLTALGGRRVEHLSGGERQRVVFARALAQRPTYLLLDEPTNHLDVRYQVELLAHARRQAAGGLGVLAVLHDLNLAARSCDRLVLLSRGRVAAAGTPAAVLDAERLSAVYGTPVATLDTAAGPVIVPTIGGQAQ